MLARLVAEVRSGEYDRIHAMIANAPDDELRMALDALLEVPEGRHVTEFERLRTPVVAVSGQGMKDALDRAADVYSLKAGEVDLARIPPVKLAELARPPWSLKERSTATSTTLTASQLHLLVSGPEDSTSIEVVVPHAQH